jgi:S1-C subfamily serine protease
VWTAAHVVANDSLNVKAKVLFGDQNEFLGEGVFDAVLLGISYVDDIALYWVRMPIDLIGEATFENVNPLSPGDPIFSVGNFLGNVFPESVSVGVVAATGRIPRLGGWDWPLTDQSDLTALPGASGGGVWSVESGKVVGIVVAGVSATVSAYVPNRVIHSWSKSSGVDWAMYGTVCPSDSGLIKLAEIVAAEVRLRESFFFLLPVP